jgi:hypothetical protein
MKVEHSIRELHGSLNGTAKLVENEAKELLEDYCKKKKWIFNHRRKEKVSFAQKYVFHQKRIHLLVLASLAFQI